MSLNFGVYNHYSSCQVVDVKYSVVFAKFCIVALSLPLLHIIFSRSISAVYFKLFTTASIFLLGIWFLLAAYVIMLCKPMALSNVLFPSTLVALVFLSSSVFIYYQREALISVLHDNKRAFNFETMQFSFLTPVFRKGGSNVQPETKYIIAASLSGIMLYRIPYNELSIYNINLKHIADYFGFFCMWFAGYALVGYVALGELYITWCIHKKNKLHKGKMMVKELL